MSRNLQSSFRIKFNKLVIYIDPLEIEEENHDADYIFITHEHHDHFDLESIKKIIKDETAIVTSDLVHKKLIQDKNLTHPNIVSLKPNNHLDLDKYISLDTQPAYNLDKWKEPDVLFHPKENNGLGFILTLNFNEEKIKLYHMGDTDFLPEYQIIEGLDILLIPVGGTYVMTSKEAAKANNQIKPLVSVPMHYDVAAGTMKDAKYFIQNIENEGIIL